MLKSGSISTRTPPAHRRLRALQCIDDSRRNSQLESQVRASSSSTIGAMPWLCSAFMYAVATAARRWFRSFDNSRVSIGGGFVMFTETTCPSLDVLIRR
jgi:hypothetical protein